MSAAVSMPFVVLGPFAVLLKNNKNLGLSNAKIPKKSQDSELDVPFSESETSVIEVEGHDESHPVRNADSTGNGLELATRSSSLIRFYPSWCSCFGTAGRRHPTEGAPCSQKWAYFCQCPPAGPLPHILSFLVIFLVGWALLFLLLGKVVIGPILSLLVLEIVGLFSGLGLRLLGLPALLAPLALGILIRNLDWADRLIFKSFGEPYVEISQCYEELHFHNASYNVGHNQELITCCNKHILDATANWITPIREIALTLILTRAGLELSPKQLKKLKGVVPLLAFGPCVVEALTCALLFFLFFQELEPSIWFCLVAGFALSAVSPAVVVPGAMSLKKRGFGVSKGVPTLLIASSSIDDVLAITLYTIFLSIGISQSPKSSETEFRGCGPGIKSGIHFESNWANVLATIGAIPLGVLHGLILGCFLHFVPSRTSPSVGIQRLVLTIVLNVTTVLAFERTHVFSGAGSIGVLVTSFVASFGWRSQAHWKAPFHKVEHTLGHIWTMFVPILFGTIGKEIRFIPEREDPYKVTSNLTKHEIYLEETFWDPFSPYCIVRVIGIILICLSMRSLASFLIVGKANLNKKERLFVAIAWLPKATVQAALAPIVLSVVLENAHTVQMMCIAKLIVTLAVVGIILSAPLGAILIALTGPRLLRKEEEEEKVEEEEEGMEGMTMENSTTSILSVLSDHEFPGLEEERSSTVTVRPRGDEEVTRSTARPTGKKLLTGSTSIMDFL